MQILYGKMDVEGKEFNAGIISVFCIVRRADEVEPTEEYELQESADTGLCGDEGPLASKPGLCFFHLVLLF